MLESVRVRWVLLLDQNEDKFGKHTKPEMMSLKSISLHASHQRPITMAVIVMALFTDFSNDIIHFSNIFSQKCKNCRCVPVLHPATN